MKHFNSESFKKDLKERLDQAKTQQYCTFEHIFMNVLDQHAPNKKKMVRANNKPYVTKAMRKAIMIRSALANKFRSNPTEENCKQYKKQRNFCSKLYKKERRKYYENLDLSKITDNKMFWKTVKPLLSNKTTITQKITLKEGDKIVSDDQDVANTLNKHFIDSVRCLSHSGGCDQHILNLNCLEDPLKNVICRFRYHPSIIAIKNNNSDDAFNFATLTENEVSDEIKKLDPTKASTGISIKMLKDNVDIITPTLTEIFNSCINEGVFPDELKLANITPIFKSVDSTSKKNYRPVSILNSVSKLFEKLIQK